MYNISKNYVCYNNTLYFAFIHSHHLKKLRYIAITNVERTIYGFDFRVYAK